MNPSDKRTEILVGLFVLFGLVLLGGLVFRFGSIRDHFRERDTYYVTFRDTSGLTDACPVRLGGTRIGKVAKPPRLREDGNVLIEMEIYRDERNRIPKGARITVGKGGLMGDSFVSITRPEPPIMGYLKPGDTIAGASSGGLDDLQQAANEISEQTQIVLRDIRSGLTNLNTAIAKLDKDVLAQENLDNFKKTLAGLNEAVTKIDNKVIDDENTSNLKETLANIRTASENISKESTRIDTIMQKADVAVTKFGSAADALKEFVPSAKKAAEKAGLTLGEINSGTGLTNALIHDVQLRNDFKSLIANLKERGILFYKDKSDERAARVAPKPAPAPTPVPKKRQ